MSMVHRGSLDVTVLVPAFSIDQLLLRALQSVSTQHIHRIILIHDGGPVDESYFNRISDLGIDVNLNSETLGVATRLNEGLKLCKTSLVARLDSDDLAIEGRFAHQSHILEESNADYCFGRALNKNLDGKSRFGLQRPSLRGEKLDPITLLTGNPVVHPTVMMKSSWLESMGGYPQVVSEDYALWLIGGIEHSVGISIRDPLIYRGSHPGQISRNISIKGSAAELSPYWKLLRAKTLPFLDFDDERTLRQILSIRRSPTSEGYVAADKFLIDFLRKALTELDSKKTGQSKWIKSQLMLSFAQILSRR